MKTIEEKAKRYDEAIEKAKDYYHLGDDKYKMAIDAKAVMEYIFPELKESEDEKIRKNLIELLLDTPSQDIISHHLGLNEVLAWLEKQGNKYDKIVEKAKSEKQRVLLTETNGNAGIDWDTRSLADTKMLLEYGLDFINKKLEKQGEQKPIIPKFRIGDIITPKNKNEHYTITDIVDEWYEFREKHINGGIPIYYQDGWQLVEQKPAWSEEDEKMFECALNMIEWYSVVDKDKSIHISNWFKSLKDRIQPQPKQEWSEDDEVALKDVCDWLDRLSMTFVGNESIVCQEEIKWLKSLKDRIQPKVELTQLDKNILEAAIAFVAQNDHFNCWRGVDKHTVLSALHSLRPKKQWKPSKEQMDMLAKVCSTLHLTSGENEIMESIYEQLKALHRYEQDT